MIEQETWEVVVIFYDGRDTDYRLWGLEDNATLDFDRMCESHANADVILYSSRASLPLLSRYV